MARFGFEYTDPTPPKPVTITHARLYGVTDANTAQVYGYHAPISSGTGSAEQGSAQDRQLTEAAASVLTGEVQTHSGRKVPNNGCAGEAVKKLESGAGLEEQDRWLVEELIAEASERTKNDSRVMQVFKKWSACMKSAGFVYRDPPAVLSDPKFATDAAASLLEKATASADVRCKSQNNIIGVWSTVEMAYQSVLIEKNQLRLGRIKGNLSVRVRNAERVLTGEMR
ncbi:hypothetical protein [Streptomyces sp. WMMC940]|uniref:hypothetical protein n=1 Tax=Streptomyces sp. WMMC940 TaxID=3015153 RepID=UPI0022B601FC|nr:hypothetical protein [Streptomyces sp. WMMC940]MCZ7460637.1 hypothetical protein [Streptomyces sp. WMMC940]